MQYLSSKSHRYFTPCFTHLEMLSEQEFNQIMNELKLCYCVYETSEFDDGLHDISIFGELPVGLEDIESSNLWRGDKMYIRLHDQYWEKYYNDLKMYAIVD